MGKRFGIKVHSYRLRRRSRASQKRLQAWTHPKRPLIAILVKTETVKGAGAFGKLVVETAIGVHLPERFLHARKSRRHRGKWASEQNGIESVLLVAFRGSKDEELVGDERAANIAPVYLTFPVMTISTRQAGRQYVAVAIVPKQITMDFVSTGSGHNACPASGTQLIRRRRQQSAQPKLLNCSRRDALGGCAHGLVGHIQPVNRDASGATVPPIKRKRGEAVLGWVDGPTVLRLNTRFESRRGEKVPVIQWQTANVLAGERTRNRLRV